MAHLKTLYYIILNYSRGGQTTARHNFLYNPSYVSYFIICNTSVKNENKINHTKNIT